MNIDNFFKSKIKSTFHNVDWANNFSPKVDGGVHHIQQDDTNSFYVAKKWTDNSREYGYIAIMNLLDGEKIEAWSDDTLPTNHSFDNEWLPCQQLFEQKVNEVESAAEDRVSNVQTTVTSELEDTDIANYQQELISAIDIFSQANTSLDNAGEKTENSLFDIAKILVSADKKLDNKKKFTNLKKFTIEKLGKKSIGNMNKAIKVASDERIAYHKDRLPNRFSVLYALTSLKDDQFNQLLQNDEITPSITRQELLEKVKEIKGASKPIRYTIKPTETDVEVTAEEISKLKDALAALGWSIVKRAEKA
jgi:hypothetical protein